VIELETRLNLKGQKPAGVDSGPVRADSKISPSSPLSASLTHIKPGRSQTSKALVDYGVGWNGSGTTGSTEAIGKAAALFLLVLTAVFLGAVVRVLTDS
jgi:hypothetical protein